MIFLICIFICDFMKLFYSVLSILRLFEYTSKDSDEHTALVIVCVCMYVCLFTTRFIYVRLYQTDILFSRSIVQIAFRTNKYQFLQCSTVWWWPVRTYKYSSVKIDYCSRYIEFSVCLCFVYINKVFTSKSGSKIGKACRVMGVEITVVLVCRCDLEFCVLVLIRRG